MRKKYLPKSRNTAHESRTPRNQRTYALRRKKVERGERKWRERREGMTKRVAELGPCVWPWGKARVLGRWLTKPGD